MCICVYYIVNKKFRLFSLLIIFYIRRNKLKDILLRSLVNRRDHFYFDFGALEKETCEKINYQINEIITLFNSQSDTNIIR